MSNDHKPSSYLARAYESLAEDIIKAAEIETTIKKLLDEIEKTKRRVDRKSVV